MGTDSSAARMVSAVRALVDGKDEHRRGERLNQDADAGQAVEHNEQLHQHGRAADDPDIKPGQPLQNGHMGKLHQRHRHRDDKRQRE